MDLELRHLRYFVAVAEELHFGRAAVRLGVAQPSLSRQIQQLETFLRTDLFTRTQRNIELTEAGSILLVEAQVVLRHVERATRLASRAGHPSRLTLAFEPLAGFHGLPDLEKQFAERRPDVRVDMEQLAVPTHCDALMFGEIDAIYTHNTNTTAPGAVFEALSTEPLVAVLPEQHRLASQSEILPAQLADEPFIMLARETAPVSYDLILALCGKAGFKPRVAQEPTSHRTMVDQIAGGYGVALGPDCVRNCGRAGLTYRPVAGSDAMVECGLIYVPKQLSKASLALLADWGAGARNHPALAERASSNGDAG